MASLPPPAMSHGKMEDEDEEVPLFIVCMNVINTVTHLLLGGVAVTAFICVNLYSHYTWNLFPSLSAHVYITMIGYVFLMSQAILSLNPKKGWGNNFKYPQKTKFYWLLQVIGSAVAVIGAGMGMVTTGRIINWAWFHSHLSTSHQIVGFIVMLLTTVSLVGGIAQLVATNRVNTKMYKTAYAGVSTCALILAYIAAILGFVEFREFIYDPSTNLAISFSVLAIVGLLTMWIANYVSAGKLVI